MFSAPLSESYAASPLDGADVMDHVTGGADALRRSARISMDAYTALIIIAAVAALWLLGGYVFKSANI